MDIDTLTEEVMRRLLIKIREEQEAHALAKPLESPSDDSSCCCAPATKKLVITQEKAANIAPNSKVTFPRGTVITPLARDTFKDRNVCIEFD
jgi:hypothetical protein